jgi:Co/Zn/Cd efflux system component
MNGIYLHKIFDYLLLPRLLLMALFILFMGVCILDTMTGLHVMAPSWPWWTTLALLYASAMLIATPSSFYNTATLKALLKIPVLLFSMLKALLRMKKNKSGFIHTPKEFSG